jgi:hypothetical protein
VRRLTPTASAVPADLKTYDWRRWEREATAAHAGDWRRSWPHSFVVVIYGPDHYREALTKAVGPVAGDRYFYAQMDTPRVRKHKLAAARAGAESTKGIT